MVSHQELQVQQKREVEKKEETTIPARVFVPATDIFETWNTTGSAPSAAACLASTSAACKS